MFPVPAFLRFLLLVLATGSLAPASLHAELTPEQKKDLFRKSHAASSPSPSPKHGTGKAKHSSTSGKHSSPSTKKHTASQEKHSSSVVKKPLAADPPSPPMHSPAPVPATSPSTPAHPARMPSSSLPASLPLPHGATPSAPITIEKSGTEADQGLASVPEPPPAVSRGWGWLFGSHRTS